MAQNLRNEPHTGELAACNPAYAFSLVRKGSDRPWAVASLHLRHGEESNPGVQEAHASMTRLHHLIKAGSEELRDLVRQPTFRVVRSTTENRRGTELVKIEFDNTHPLTKDAQTFFAIQSGSLLLDPNRFWCLWSCELRNKYSNSDSKITVETELRDLVAKYPVPRRCVVTNESFNPDKGPRVFKTVDQFDLAEPSPLPPDQEFTLAAFGLPEPFEVQAQRSQPRWYLWAGLAGAGCLALGMVLHRLKRRVA